MTNSQLRYLAHKVLDHLEWINRHATTRQDKHRAKLEGTLRDIEKIMLKMIDAPLRENDLELPEGWPQRIP